MKYILTDSVKHLNIPCVKVEKRRFSDGELSIKIKENLKGREVIVVSNIFEDNVLEFLFIVDAVKRMGAKIKEVVIPFMSYARQDKLYEKGSSVSGAVVCSLLKGLNVPVKIFDIHSLELRRYLNFRNVSLLPVLIDFLPKRDFVVVSPDLGGKMRAALIADILRAPLRVIEKVRKNGIKMKFDEDLRGGDVLIVEDMISSGETLIKACGLLKKNGAGDIYCISTHGLFVGDALKRLRKCGIKKIFVTNTVHRSVNPQNSECWGHVKRSRLVEVFDLGELFFRS